MLHFGSFYLFSIDICMSIKMLIHDLDWLRKAAYQHVSSRLPTRSLLLDSWRLNLKFLNNVANVREAGHKVYAHFCCLKLNVSRKENVR